MPISLGKKGKKIATMMDDTPKAELDLSLNNNSSLWAFELMIPHPKASRDLAWDPTDSPSSRISRATNKLSVEN